MPKSPPQSWSLEGHLDDSWEGNPSLTSVPPGPLCPHVPPHSLVRQGGEAIFPICLSVYIHRTQACRFRERLWAAESVGFFKEFPSRFLG